MALVWVEVRHASVFVAQELSSGKWVWVVGEVQDQDLLRAEGARC